MKSYSLFRNRRRTKALVEKLDKQLLSRVDGKREHLSHISPVNSALRRIKKEAYYHHIHHTAAIEGNTLSLAQTRTILETGYAVGGNRNYLIHFEMMHSVNHFNPSVQTI